MRDTLSQMRIGELLREWRWARKLTVRQAAKLIGISGSTMSRMENGLQPDGRTLAKVIRWAIEEI